MSANFEETKKTCKFRTYQDNKCVNDKNKVYRKIQSCQEKNCPLKGKPADSEEESKKD
jgi:hypothetical protein